MKPLLTGIILLLPFLVKSQSNGIRLMPEGGFSFPTGDFKEPYTFGKQGSQLGIHLDKFWGSFGIGLFAGLNQNGIMYEDQLPVLSGSPDLTRISEVSKDKWKQLLFGLGPVIKLKLSAEWSIDLSSKVGLGSMNYPEYKEKLVAGAPFNEIYSLYETKHDSIKKKLNPMLRSTMGLSFNPTEKLSISIGANYTVHQNVLHSYSYLDADFAPGMTNEEILQMVRTSRTVTEVRKCNFNTFGVTLGFAYTFGKGKDKQKEENKMEPPILEYPEDGATITSEEADSLVLKWLKETPKVEEANYNLWLYEVRDTTEKSDSLIFQTEVTRSHQLDLPEDVHLRAGIAYRWWVRAIGSRRLDPCPGDCYSNKFQFRIGTPVDVVLRRKLDSGFYSLNRGVLRFKFEEEYVNNNSELEFNIYDYTRTVVISNATPGVTLIPLYKDNRFVLDINSINPSLPQGYYVLEVKDKTGEIWMLRFKL